MRCIPLACVLVCSCSLRPLHLTDAPDGGQQDAREASTPETSTVEGPQAGWLDAVVPVGAGGMSRAVRVVPLSDGGVILAGVFTGTVQFASDKVLTTRGELDGFVARFRADQRLVWVLQVGGTGYDVINALTRLPHDEVAIAGWFVGTVVFREATSVTTALSLTSAGMNDAFVARIAADGSVRWARGIGGPGDDIARGVASDSSGVLAVAGATGTGAVFGLGEPGETVMPAGQGPIFIASYRGDGSLDWARFAGESGAAQPYALSMVDGEASPVMTGYFNVRVTFGAGTPGERSLLQSNGRVFVAKYTRAGALAWVTQLGGAEAEGRAIGALSDGTVALSGVFTGEASFVLSTGTTETLSAGGADDVCSFLARLTSDGRTTWVRRVGSSGGVRAYGLAMTGDGSALVTGAFVRTALFGPDGANPVARVSAGDDDIFFAAFDPAGDLRWASSAGGLGQDDAGAITEASDGAIWAVGTYTGPAMFGAGEGSETVLASSTDGNGFLARLLP